MPKITKVCNFSKSNYLEYILLQERKDTLPMKSELFANTSRNEVYTFSRRSYTCDFWFCMDSSELLSFSFRDFLREDFCYNLCICKDIISTELV